MTDELSSNSTIRERPLSKADVEALASRGTPFHLVDCVLKDVDLAGLELADWTFERCDLRQTDFTGSSLERSKLHSCRGASATFVGARLSDASFVSSDLSNASLRRSVLASASFHGCKLTGADLTEARALGVTFAETLLVYAKLAGFNFRNGRFLKVDFAQADLRKCDFRFAVFEECSLREANLVDAQFEGADLRGADLGGLKLLNAASFRGATISSNQAGQILGELGLKVK